MQTRRNVRNFTALFLVLFLISFNYPYFRIEKNEKIIDKSVKSNQSSFTEHNPILINDNASFDTDHGISTGDGTQINPYIMESWIINANGGEYGIKINYTTLYVNIRNCIVFNAQQGIYLDHAENIVITNCTVRDSFVNHGIDATNSSTAENGFYSYGIRCKNTGNINISSNYITNILAGNGGNGIDDSEDYRYSGQAGSAYGIHFFSSSSSANIIDANFVSYVQSGNGGNGGSGEIIGNPSSGASGSASGEACGIYARGLFHSILNNTIEHIITGNGGNGGKGGNTSGESGYNGGAGGDSKPAYGIRISYCNQYHNLGSDHLDKVIIHENHITELQGGQGGWGAWGGNTDFANTGGAGGNGGSGGFATALSIAYSEALDCKQNIGSNIIHGLHGMGGGPGLGIILGNIGSEGLSGRTVGLSIIYSTDGEISANSFLNLENVPHDSSREEYGLYIYNSDNFLIVGNDFEGYQDYIHYSSQIILNDLNYGNYWGTYSNALNNNPKDGFMDFPYIIPGDNYTDDLPLAFPIHSDSDGDSLNILQELALSLNPVENDTDFDNIPDNIEIDLGFNPTNPQDGFLDYDDDGLLNYQEILLGTNFSKKDSDSDGWTDFDELQYGSNPLNATEIPKMKDYMTFRFFVQNYGGFVGSSLIAIAIISLGLILHFSRQNVPKIHKDNKSETPENTKKKTNIKKDGEKPKIKRIKQKSPDAKK